MIKIIIEKKFIETFKDTVVKKLSKKLKYIIENKVLLGNTFKKEINHINDTTKYFYPNNTHKQKILQTIKNPDEIVILKNLQKDLITIITNDTKDMRKIIEIFEKDFKDVLDKNSNIYKIVYEIFVNIGYEQTICKSKATLAYKLVENVNIKTCPYCNRNYISIIQKTNSTSKKTRPQLDHFFPKDKFPFLACSIYNLIPSCSTCNHMKSNEDSYSDKLISPYEINDDEFKFTYDLNNLGILNHFNLKELYLDNENSISIDIETIHTANLKYFELKKLYKMHKDIVIELLIIEMNYPKEYIKSLIDNNFATTEEEVYRFIFSNYLEKENLHKRPLSKLTLDIVKELSILTKIKYILEENKK